MDINYYLETLPYKEIAKITEGPPKDTVAYSGFPKQHPTEKNKLILIHDPLGEKPVVIEFKIEDVQYVEDVHSAVTETGEGVRLVKLWIRKGAHGMILEPFEVKEGIKLTVKAQEARERLIRPSSP